MEEQIIKFETAKLAKQKGFKEGTVYAYNSDQRKIHEYGDAENWNEKASWRDYKAFSAPTQALLAKWLREEHDILVLIDTSFFNLIWKIIIPDHELPEKIVSDDTYNTYEEALETGLQHALTLIKS